MDKNIHNKILNFHHLEATTNYKNIYFQVDSGSFYLIEHKQSCL